LPRVRSPRIRATCGAVSASGSWSTTTVNSLAPQICVRAEVIMYPCIRIVFLVLSLWLASCGGRQCPQTDLCAHTEWNDFREGVLIRANKFLNGCPRDATSTLDLLVSHEQIFERCSDSTFNHYLSLRVSTLCALGRFDEARRLLDRLGEIEQSQHLQTDVLTWCLQQNTESCGSTTN
jgi:hypothetical protein